MAIARNWNLEWLNHNANRKYPLAVDASGRSTDGEFELPEDFIVACYLSLNAGHTLEISGFAITNITISPAGATVLISGSDKTGELHPVAATMIPKAVHKQYRSYRLGGLAEFYDLDGWLTVDQFDSIDMQPAGSWDFDLSGGRLELDVVRPQIRGVSRLRVQSNGELSQPIVGDVVLRAGNNMRISPVLVAGEDPVLLFDAINGAGLNEECVCAGDVQDAPPIRTINKIPGTPDGDFTFLGNNCLEFVPIEHGLQARDTCSEPCCGCPELESVTKALELLDSQATTLENFLVSLEARTTQMDQVVLGSRLGDRGCIQCN